MLIDSHCHLNFDVLNKDLKGVIDRAHNASVLIMQTISTSLEDLPGLIKICTEYENVYCSMGLHPCHVGKAGVKLPTSKELISLSKNPKIIGIGEAGLDYYHDASAKDLQKQIFIEHIEVSNTLSMPLIVHSRDAEEDTFEILKTYMLPHSKVIIHCFTGTLEFAKKCLDLGCYISFSGVITFKNALQIREVVKCVPMNKVLVETDAPYLAPMPHRGKSNEPAYVRYVAECVADIKNISIEKVEKATTENFLRLFSKCKI